MYGVWTVLPPILAIVVALLSKNVILALFAGMCSISVMTSGLDFLGPIGTALVDGIAGGQVEPNPYSRGNHNACRYCEYASACHLDLWGQPRSYRAVSAEEFWEQVEQEGTRHD